MLEAPSDALPVRQPLGQTIIRNLIMHVGALTYDKTMVFSVVFINYLVALMIIDGGAQEQRDLFFQRLALRSFPIMSTQQDWEQETQSIRYVIEGWLFSFVDLVSFMESLVIAKM